MEDAIYKEAWEQLYNAFGERMQTEELELMDAVLSGVKIDQEEILNALQNETAD